MVATTLTDSLIKGGEALLKALETVGVNVDAAFWFLFPEQGFWKLMLSLPGVEKEGPRAAYARIQRALATLQGEAQLSLDDIAIAKPGAPIVHLLRSAVRTGHGIGGIRFSNNVINGVLISDAYIYRLT